MEYLVLLSSVLRKGKEGGKLNSAVPTKFTLRLVLSVYLVNFEKHSRNTQLASSYIQIERKCTQYFISLTEAGKCIVDYHLRCSCLIDILTGATEPVNTSCRASYCNLLCAATNNMAAVPWSNEKRKGELFAGGHRGT